MEQQGEATQSHKPVDPNEDLYRGVTAHQIKFDEKLRRYRPSSAAFKDRRGELSVDIASKTTAAESLSRLPKSIAISSFHASVPIEWGYSVVAAPVFNAPGVMDNPAHAVITNGKAMSSKHARELAVNHCSWAIPPR